MTPQEIQAARSIYTRAETLIGPYYGRIQNIDIEDFISNNKWIMFPKHGVESLREGVFYPFPNVFLSFEGDIVDDENGRAAGTLGVTYHNVDAMIVFNHMLRYRENQIMSKMKAFKDHWDVEIQTKTKTDTPQSTPHYDVFWGIKPSELTAPNLRVKLRECEQQLLNRGDEYPGNGNPVIWQVPIVVISKEVTYQSFDEDFREIFQIFLRLL